MTLHVISDNPLFLIGISEKAYGKLSRTESHKIKIHYSNFSEKEISGNDSVLIFIYCKKIRMNVLERITKISSKIAIMVDSNFEKEMSATYPMRVCRKITFREMLNLGKKIKQQSSPLKVCDHTYNIFTELYSGKSIRSVVENKNLNLTTIYSLKTRVFRKFGLKNINDKGIIHCMEYLEANRLAREVQNMVHD